MPNYLTPAEAGILNAKIQGLVAEIKALKSILDNNSAPSQPSATTQAPARQSVPNPETDRRLNALAAAPSAEEDAQITRRLAQRDARESQPASRPVAVNRIQPRAKPQVSSSNRGFVKAASSQQPVRGARSVNMARYEETPDMRHYAPEGVDEYDNDTDFQDYSHIGEIE